MIRGLLLAAVMCAFVEAATAAQNGRPPANAAALEDLLAHQRYSDLSAVFAQATSLPDLLLLANWQEAKVVAGAGLFLSYEYSQTLARAARAAPDDVTDFRETGASFLVYAYAVAAVDGLACENHAFAAARSNAVAAPSLGLWRYIAGMSPDHGDFLIDNALQMETALAGKRAPDDFLCGADGIKSKDPSFSQRQDARALLNTRVHAIVSGYRGK